MLKSKESEKSLMLSRSLFSGDHICPSNCLYCFAKWLDYNCQSTLRDWQNQAMCPVVYPCCDSDFERNSEILPQLWKMAKELSSLYVSISTKHTVNDDILTQYKDLNRSLIDNGKGFVKISVSITTKYRIQELEQCTDAYDERRKFFSYLKSLGFATSIIFKPVLPFIDYDEYKEIIDDFSDCQYFLLGNLYINESTEFYRRYIENQYDLAERQISWLDERPLWKYVIQTKKLKKIAKYIQSLDKFVFNNDIDLIEHIVRRGLE